MAACLRFTTAADIILLVDQDGSRGDYLEDLDFAGERFQKLNQHCILKSE